MSKTPPFKEEKYFEHPRYAEFLVEVGDNATYMALPSKSKQAWFQSWFRAKETCENAEDFRNLVPMHIRMNTEEWNWFKSKIDAEETEHLPNLKALSDCPPHGFKELE